VRSIEYETTNETATLVESSEELRSPYHTVTTGVNILAMASLRNLTLNSIDAKYRVTSGIDVVGNLLGLPVITDANITTTDGGGTDQDQIYVVKADDHILFEDNLFQLKFEETNAGSLTTKMVVYGYVAFASGRYPTGITKIQGTGLITPSF